MKKVPFQDQQPTHLIVDGSRVWLSCTESITNGLLGVNTRGWDFGVPGSSLISPPNEFSDSPCFNFATELTQNPARLTWIVDEVSKKRVFNLPRRFSKLPTILRWDKWCLVVGYHSWDILILDLSHVYSK